MKYYRYQDTFYKVVSITPQTRIDINTLILVEYSETVGRDILDLRYDLPNGNIGALVNKETWSLEVKEIQEIDYFVWRHIGAPSGKGD